MSRSGTSPAICTGWLEASKQRIGPTPLWPLTQEDQKAALPMPLGATTPNPVIATRRMAPLQYGLWIVAGGSSRGGVACESVLQWSDPNPKLCLTPTRLPALPLYPEPPIFLILTDQV